MPRRREFLKGCSMGVAVSALGSARAAAAGTDALVIDSKPLFDISPYLYMQFMEPLGSQDWSVEAAWIYRNDYWIRSFVDVPLAKRTGNRLQPIME